LKLKAEAEVTFVTLKYIATVSRTQYLQLRTLCLIPCLFHVHFIIIIIIIIIK